MTSISEQIGCVDCVGCVMPDVESPAASAAGMQNQSSSSDGKSQDCEPPVEQMGLEAVPISTAARDTLQRGASGCRGRKCRVPMSRSPHSAAGRAIGIQRLRAFIAISARCAGLSIAPATASYTYCAVYTVIAERRTWFAQP